MENEVNVDNILTEIHQTTTVTQHFLDELVINV